MSARARIRDLVLTKLTGRKIDVVGFIENLLELARDAGEIRCALASNQTIRVVLHDGEICDVEVDGCRGKLRMLCARLAVLCRENAKGPLAPYGGEGAIRTQTHNGLAPLECTIQFKNTPEEHAFTIIPPTIANPQISATLRGHGLFVNGYDAADAGSYDGNLPR